MTARKTERLLNLVICLLHTRRHLSVQEIRMAVPGYAADSEEAFRRMFERDKAELRDLGIPLETGTDHAAHDDELGYRIARRDYELPPVTLEADEAAALGLAARLLNSAPLASATASALLKLRAAGPDAADVGEGPAWTALEPQIGGNEPAFEACLAGVTERQRLRFAYRAAGGEQQQRELEPWGVVWWHGRWYLVGHDTGRAASRVFRLSRIVGNVEVHGEPGEVTPPADLDLRAHVAQLTQDGSKATAQIRLRTGAGWALRRGATAVHRDGSGWDVLDLPYSDVEQLADQVVGFGADAVALNPPEARDAVVRRLRAAAGAAT